MSNESRLDDYYSNDAFLALVEEFDNEHYYIEDLVNAIEQEISSYIMSSRYNSYDIHEKMSCLSEAQTHINALRYILRKREEEQM
jgi:hypothetical protein